MKKLFIFITILIIVIGTLAYRTASSAGVFYAIEPHFSGKCEVVPGVIGAEDITIDHANQYAYISAVDRRVKNATGGIYGLDLTNSTAKPVLLTLGFTDDFNPHGFSLYKGDNGEQSLFVINHRADGQQQVDIFDITQPGVLKHRTAISYPELTTPNDLVAVGPFQFYATNDHGSDRGSLLRMAEDYIGLPLSNVSYFDGTKGSIVASGLRYGNGITVSPDSKTLYVAEVTGRKINVFNRDLNTGALSKQDEISVNSGADNLEWDEAGNLWLAGHPRLLDFVAHANDPKNKSPSQVIKINISADKPVVTEVFLSTGDDISGSTVGAVSGDKLLIGSVYEEFILRCKL